MNTDTPPEATPHRTPKEQANVTTVLKMFDDGWGANAGWEDVWRANAAPNVRTYFHSHPPMEGLEAAIEFNAELFKGFPRLEMTVENTIAKEDAVIVRGRLVGSQDGPFLGAPASGAAVDVPDVTLFRLEDGKIVESRYFTDLLAVMIAIGAVKIKD
ncbi:ester cyclase [uncultured Roseobacter sp.]|uniref:ester cyclase n=1 Tax=uncultured Roseobacter sp. TaxID=114847 RepID=UPI0026255B5A|nr:ester cyclase [uncultured Roseobacter sp.]